MKLTKYTMPYPILGIGGDFEEGCIVSKKLTFNADTTLYHFNIELTLNDQTILGYINDDKAIYACEVDCPKTFYRKIFTSKDNKFSLEIHKDALMGNVNFFFSVVVTTNLDNYRNPSFNHRYYSSYSFNLQRGHLLAYFGQEIFNADIKYNELKAIGSILEVKEDAKENYTHYDFSSPKIRIFLPTSDFKNFIRSNNQKLADITHASIVQCGLVCALYAYNDNKNTLWAQTLELRTKMEDKLKPFADIGNLDGKQISQMVSIILDNPNNRMFEKLVSIQNDNE